MIVDLAVVVWSVLSARVCESDSVIRSLVVSVSMVVVKATRFDPLLMVLVMEASKVHPVQLR